MQQFDDELPVRKFDNFQFVPLTATIAECRKKKMNEKVPSSSTLPIPQFNCLMMVGHMHRHRD
jgi:hypothetical protein